MHERSRRHTRPWRREPRARAQRGARLRLSAASATAGLVAVLAVLTVFSVTAAVTNARATAQARESAAVSEWSKVAERSLLHQEALVDQLATERDAGQWAAFEAAGADTRTAIREMGAVAGTGHGELIDEWLRLHARYEYAVGQLLVATRDNPGIAEPYEEVYVDPHLEALETLIQEEAAEHWDEANASLESMEDVQRVLLVATPVLFGVGLGLVAWFTLVLTRSRRETVAQAERNRQLALHDALTGLPNRTLLRQRVDGALAGCHPGAVGLVLIDLDRFKEINDTLGHAYGDVVLQAVADRLRATVRGGDTVARLGGDEFAVLLSRIDDEESARQLAGRALVAMEAPIEVDGVSLDVDASIGIALSGAHGDDVESLLQNADIAMYSAKERGLGVCVYDASLNEHSPERLGLLGQLRRAIDNRELVLHFQPKVALPGAHVSGVEALVRWEHPQRGLIAPGDFIPLAERTPIIRPLTRYVLDAALEQCARWRDAGRVMAVAVNVSVRNLLDEHFVDEVCELLAHWRVPASCLELEVTESAITADPDRARRILTRLAACGVTLSIDDFGAGYTSLAQLKDLPVHQLKIDRSFVASMAADRSNALIVRSVVELGHNLGLTTVAEGVEDEATCNSLAAMGCDVAQGYHLCPPMTAEQLEAWFDATVAVRASGQEVGCAPAVGDVSSCDDESCEESPRDELSDDSDDSVGSLSVVGSTSEVRVGVADPVSSLSEDSSSSDVDSSSEPVVGALVSVAGAVLVGEDGDDGSWSCCSEDDDAFVIAPIVVDREVSVPLTSADTGFCPMSSMPVTMPMAMTKTAAA
ncbi:putative bifunctional diguanylate cyclase/phosphodiesterase [Geodermatophilus chilensis]|uniref:putative bifunctional diguanylate cyclase/phosphodiesterase n=1 Tax=Geodermatophilus chilensis TaxID=2035835 RepID=UPI000C263436|nr:EAL domain-containing protein [Geodermatophilus chilensis]